MQIRRNKRYYYVSKMPITRIDPIVKLYPSIDQALSSFIKQNLTGMTLYVYEVIPRRESIMEPRIEEEPFRDILGTFLYLAPIKTDSPIEIKVESIKETLKITSGFRGLKTPILKYKWSVIREKTLTKLYWVGDGNLTSTLWTTELGALSEYSDLVGKDVIIKIPIEKPEVKREESTGKLILKKPVKTKEYKKVTPISMKKLGKMYLYKI